MRCVRCHKKLRENDRLLPVCIYVKNDRRGDFVSNAPSSWVHLACPDSEAAND